MATDQQWHNLIYEPLGCLIVDPITHGTGEYDRDFIFSVRRWEFVPRVEVGGVNAISNYINVESIFWRQSAECAFFLFADEEGTSRFCRNSAFVIEQNFTFPGK
ncbi:hypothetical protein SDC9_200373 [bioreactor metagenome]|uniref:Uncharacterized protein n=1 Tax=bioreactor metagenome TaxID=1076179 RepID=A0A645IN33_9ZZZZ